MGTEIYQGKVKLNNHCSTDTNAVCRYFAMPILVYLLNAYFKA
jgi:hypothetical protein